MDDVRSIFFEALSSDWGGVAQRQDLSYGLVPVSRDLVEVGRELAQDVEILSGDVSVDGTDVEVGHHRDEKSDVRLIGG
jgi:hypothetical protein